MKKSLVAALILSMGLMLTACGSDSATSEAPAAEKTEEAAEAPAADGDVVSDEDFATLQENYAVLVENCATLQANVDYVNDTYMNSDAVEQSDDIEAALQQAADALAQADEVIKEMGEIEQGSLSAADAATLNDTMIELNDGMLELNDFLGELNGNMEDTQAAADAACSDETFATLQDNYVELNKAYDAAVEYYMQDDIEQSDDVEAALNQSKELIDAYGNVQQSDLSEADAVALNDQMFELYTFLTN